MFSKIYKFTSKVIRTFVIHTLVYATMVTQLGRMYAVFNCWFPSWLALSKSCASFEALTFSLLTFMPPSPLISVWLASACCFPSETIECNWKGVQFGPSGCRNSHYHIKVFLWLMPHTYTHTHTCTTLWVIASDYMVLVRDLIPLKC